MQQFKGHPAEDLARMCFSKLRFFSVSLKDKLRREGMWEDLVQELYLTAWEAWTKGLSERETYQLAGRRIHAFLKACGYRFYRHHLYRREMPFSFIAEDQGVVERVLAKAGAAPSFVREGDHLQETILVLIRENGGLSKQALYTRLQISAQELDWYCAPLIKQRLVIEIKRENCRGRPLTPLLVAMQPGQTLPAPKMVKTEEMERIRQAYFQEGKGIKQIAREFHHSRTWVRKVIRGAQTDGASLVLEAEYEPVG